MLTAPVNIPDVIPSVDLTKKVTDEADFTGKGAAGGVAKGNAVDGPSDQPYFDFQVEKQAAAVPGQSDTRSTRTCCRPPALRVRCSRSS